MRKSRHRRPRRQRLPQRPATVEATPTPLTPQPLEVDTDDVYATVPRS